MSNKDSCSLLIVGGPNAGKTVYGAQVFARLRHGAGTLRLRSAPDDIAPFEQALTRLAQGLAPHHTGASTYHELSLPLVTSAGRPVDLIWPDYGGEQIRDIVETRQIPQSWVARVRTATGWMLFVRPDRVRRYDDIISRPPESVSQGTSQHGLRGEDVNRWSDAAALVELLQILIFIRRSGMIDAISEPTLTVVLSCWDELPDAQPSTPSDVLYKRAPLLASFVHAIWKSESLNVIGLSAQGRELSPSAIDEDYVDLGPEHFGYVVLSNGRHSNDLTQPLLTTLPRVLTA